MLEAIIKLLIGLAVFITGMNLMSNGLQKSFSHQLKKLFDKLVDNKLACVGIGAFVTALIHSSAATTSMVIGFVNAGAMSLIQAACVIMGANIGTTVTGLLVSLSSLNINYYFALLAFIGVILSFFKKDKIKSIGLIFTGLGLMFVGLEWIKEAFAAESISNACTTLFNNVSFPLLLVLIGALLTALIQSSGSLTGLIIIMCGSGIISVSQALFIVLGSNIGTCVTALISSIGTNTNAKRSAMLHLLFNLIGSFIFIIIIWPLQSQISSLLSHISNPSLQIAIFHVIFNIVTTIILLPFVKQLVELATLLVKEKGDNTHLLQFIDDRLLSTPFIAMSQTKKEIYNMALLSKTNVMLTMDAILNNTKINEEDIRKREEDIDNLNNLIAKYLIKLSSLVSSNSSNQIGSYFHVINDIERIGDIAEDFLDIYNKMQQSNLSFSNEAIEELRSMYSIIDNMFDLSYSTFIKKNKSNLSNLDKLEKQSDDKKVELSAAHFERLSKSNCTIQLGAYYTSIIAYLERIADHLTNIGYSIANPTGDQK